MLFRNKPNLRPKLAPPSVTPPKAAHTPRKYKPRQGTLPPDEYKPLVEVAPKIVLSAIETFEPSSAEHSIVIQGTRGGDYGNPYVALARHINSQKYTGFMKNKTLMLPIEHLQELIEGLQEMHEALVAAGYIEEPV